jgi:hypothetical protein
MLLKSQRNMVTYGTHPVENQSRLWGLGLVVESVPLPPLISIFFYYLCTYVDHDFSSQSI